MSVYMLDDDVAMDRVNPYVLADFSLPGTVRRNERVRAGYKKAREPLAQFEKKEESPICSHGITAGDLTIDFCKKRDSLCPMSRPFYPQRNIDIGFTRPQKEKILVEKIQKKRNGYMIAALVFIVLILLILRR
jgi:hypothetical protein